LKNVGNLEDLATLKRIPPTPPKRVETGILQFSKTYIFAAPGPFAAGMKFEMFGNLARLATYPLSARGGPGNS
jgi:hypothetical protein